MIFVVPSLWQSWDEPEPEHDGLRFWGAVFSGAAFLVVVALGAAAGVLLGWV